MAVTTLPLCAVITFLLALISKGTAALSPGDCTNSILNSTLENVRFTSSSFQTANPPEMALLGDTGEWIASTGSANQWLFIDIGAIWKLSTLLVKTRERYPYLRSFRMSYSEDNLTWTGYTTLLSSYIRGEEFRFDTFGDVKNISLQPTVNARYLTFIAVEVYGRAALEVELSGCMVSDVTGPPFSTSVTENINDEQVWLSSMSPIVIDRQLVISPTGSLIVQPGIKVIFTSLEAGLKVFGSLKAHGIPGVPIGFSYPNPVLMASGKWQGIEVAATGNINMAEVFIRHAKVGVNGPSSGMMLRNCHIAMCDVGIQSERGHSGTDHRFVTSSRLSYNTKGMVLCGTTEEGFFNIDDTVIENGTTGIFIESCVAIPPYTTGVKLELTGSVVSGHSGRGIEQSSYANLNLTISNSSFLSNAVGVYVNKYSSQRIAAYVNISTSHFLMNDGHDVYIYNYYGQPLNITITDNIFYSGGRSGNLLISMRGSQSSDVVNLNILKNTFTASSQISITALFYSFQPTSFIIKENKFINCWGGINAEYNSQTEAPSSMNVSSNTFTGVSGKNRAVLEVNNFILNFTDNVLDNCSSTSGLNIKSGYLHIIKRNIFKTNNACPCLLAINTPYSNTRVVRASENYWGNTDVTRNVKPRVCDFFLDVSRARLELGNYYSSEQLDTLIDLVGEDDFAFSNDNVGGIIRSDLAVGVVNVLVNRSILIQKEANVEVGGHIRFAKDRGIVVMGKLTFGDLLGERSVVNASERSVTWKGIYVDGGAFIGRHTNISGSVNTFTQHSSQDNTSEWRTNITLLNVSVKETQRLIDFSEAEGSYLITIDYCLSQASDGVYVNSKALKELNITVNNSVMEHISGYGLRFVSSQTTIASLDIVIDNSTFDQRQNTLYLISCMYNVFLQISSSRLVSRRRDTLLYIRVYSSEVDIANNTFTGGSTSLRVETCNFVKVMKPLEKRNMVITGNSFAGMTSGSYLYWYSYYSSSSAISSNVLVANNTFSSEIKSSSSVVGIRFYNPTYQGTIVNNMTLENNTFLNLTGPSLHLTGIPKNLTVRGNTFFNNSKVIDLTFNENNNMVHFDILYNNFSYNQAPGIIDLDVTAGWHDILIRYNEFFGNNGSVIKLNTNNATIQENFFENANADFNIELLHRSGQKTGLVLNATLNYWGSTDVKTIESKLYDVSFHESLPNILIMPCLGSRNLSDIMILEETFFGSRGQIGGFVGGTVSLNSTSGPYTVVSNIIIREQESLTLEAGSVLIFNAGIGIHVIGTLAAQGNTTHPVKMKPAAYGKKWKGIQLSPTHGTTGQSFILHTYVNDTTDGIRVNGNKAVLKDVTSSNSAANCFTLNPDGQFNSQLVLKGIRAFNCSAHGVEIVLEKAVGEVKVNISQCYLAKNTEHGIHVHANVTVSLSFCDIENNQHTGVYVSRQYGTKVRLEHCQIRRNKIHAILSQVSRDFILSDNNITEHMAPNYPRSYNPLARLMQFDRLQSEPTYIQIINNNITGNVGTGIEVAQTYNYLTNFTFIMRGNTFHQNVGGLRVRDNGNYRERNVTVAIENNTFINNTQTEVSFIYAYVPYLTGLFVRYNTFRQNIAKDKQLIEIFGNNQQYGVGTIYISNNTVVNNTVANIITFADVEHAASIQYNVFENPHAQCEFLAPSFKPSYTVNALRNYWGSPELSVILPRICGFDLDVKKALILYLPFMKDAALDDVFDSGHDVFSLSNIDGGFIVGNVTLPKISQTYYIQRSILVTTGSRLVFEAGASLTFEKGRGILTLGSLVTEGSKQEPVVLSGIGIEQWHGLLINSSKNGTSRLTGMHLMNSAEGLTLLSNAVKFSNCVISNTSSSAILMSPTLEGDVLDLNGTVINGTGNNGIDIVESGNLTLFNVTVLNAKKNCIEFQAQTGNFRLLTSTLSNCTSGLDLRFTSTNDAGNVTLDGCTFHNNSEYGVKLLVYNVYSYNSIKLLNNIFTNNNKTAIETDFYQYYYRSNGRKNSMEIGFNEFHGNGQLFINTWNDMNVSFHDNVISQMTGDTSKCALKVLAKQNRDFPNNTIEIMTNTFQSINADCVLELTSNERYTFNGSFKYNRLIDNTARVGVMLLNSGFFNISENIFDNPLSVFEIKVKLKRQEGDVNVTALNNWWGSVDAASIGGRILDNELDPELVKVFYDPFLETQNFDCSYVNNCSGRGECVRTNGCKCNSGWAGVSCEEYDCAGVRYCYGNGECIGPNECECNTGWTGSQCIYATCLGQRNCSGRGVCVRPDECLCEATFTGNDCSTCISLHWGSNCLPCPKCVHGSCDISSGLCNCYEENWDGYLCDRCRKTFYGPSCLPLMMLLDVIPSSGVDTGGNTVHLWGDNFPKLTSGDYFCKFGSQVVSGHWQSSHYVTCVAPEYPEGSVVVEISPDGVNYTENKLVYTYYSSCPEGACGRDLTPSHGQCLFGGCTCNLPWSGTGCTTELMKPVIAQPAQAQTALEASRYTLQLELTQGSKPVTWSIVSAHTGASIDEASGHVTWAYIPASEEPYYFTIRARNIIGSSTVSWQLEVATSYYVNMVSVEPSGVLDSPSTVRVYGYIVFRPGFSPRVSPVDVVIRNGGRRKLLTTLTDPLQPDFFTVYYYPLPNDVGRFDVIASHPARSPVDPQVSWSVHGMTCIPDTVTWSAYLDTDTVVYTNVKLRNAGVDVISGVTAKVEGIGGPLLDAYVRRSGTDDKGFREELFAVDETVVFDIVAKASGPLRGTLYVVFSNAAGTVTRLRVYIRLSIRTPSLRLRPASLTEQVVIGKQKIISVFLRNEGGVSATNIQVSLPNDRRISRVSFSVVNSTSPSGSESLTLPPNGEALIEFSITTQPSDSLGEMRGTIAFNAMPTSYVSLSYVFYLTSTRRLNLTFAVKDEYTYFVEDSPLVPGATVELINQRLPYNQVRTTTNESGVVVFEDILEDRYTLRASAPGHGSISRVILPSADSPSDDIFLPRIAVTYTWTVTPTTVEDRYVITLESTFEAQVPMPVVTIEPAQVNSIPFELGEKNSLDFTVRNYGLVRADNLRFALPTGHPYLNFDTDVDIIGSLEANKTIIVPVKVSLKPRPARNVPATAVCGLALLYDYICGGLQTRNLDVTMTRQYPGRPPLPCGIGGTGSGSGSGYTGVSGTAGGGLSGSGSLTVYNPVTPLSCDCAKTLIKSCALAYHPIAGCAFAVTDLFTAWTDERTDGGDVILAGLNTVVGLVDTLFSCVVGIWCSICSILYTTARCIVDINANCDSSRRRRDASSEVVDGVIDSTGSMYNFFMLGVDILGDEAMLDIDHSWYSSFKPVIADDSDMGTLLTVHEFETVVGQLTDADQMAVLSKFLMRWNNTASSWEDGTLNELNDTISVINLSRLTPRLEQLRLDTEEAKAKGFGSIFDEYDHVSYAYTTAEREDTGGTDDGVCAKVRVRIVQELVLTRDAFNARLEIENGESNALENLKVEIWIKETFGGGEVKNDLFGIGSPELVGISGVHGTGRLGQDLSGSAEWLIIPTSQAAPEDDVLYDVGGRLSYSVGGRDFSVPLLPDTITVKPNPSLVVHYFHEKYVQGDDPLTEDVIEPVVPFSLAVLVMNAGYGVARALKITSSQPEIIENEKGLLVSFEIVGAQIGNSPIVASLSVDFGDIASFETKTARWLLTSSLMGKFNNFSATFENINPLGDPQLSLLDELGYHELIHLVRMDNTPDVDDFNDFLVNDRIDDNSMPDMLYNSENGTDIHKVTVTNVTRFELGQSFMLRMKSYQRAFLHIQVFGSVWFYTRVENNLTTFDQKNLKLLSVDRGDGRSIMVETNAWQTTYIQKKQLLHVFDFDDQDHNDTFQYNYTLVFGPPNMHVPQFNETFYRSSVFILNAGVFLTVSAFDLDGDEVVFSMDSSEVFGIDTHTGQMSILPGGPVELNTYRLVVLVNDTGYPSRQSTVEVEITVTEDDGSTPSSKSTKTTSSTSTQTYNTTSQTSSTTSHTSSTTTQTYNTTSQTPSTTSHTYNTTSTVSVSTTTVTDSTSSSTSSSSSTSTSDISSSSSSPTMNVTVSTDSSTSTKTSAVSMTSPGTTEDTTKTSTEKDSQVDVDKQQAEWVQPVAIVIGSVAVVALVALVSYVCKVRSAKSMSETLEHGMSSEI